MRSRAFGAICVIKVENFYCSLQVHKPQLCWRRRSPLGVDHGKCSVLKQQPAERRRKTVTTVWQSLTNLRWKALRERIPAVMSAAVYRGVDDVRLETVPVPEIGLGEILVRVHTCGICGTDLKKITTGSHPPPRIFGHETSGMVAAIGAGVNRFARRSRDGVPSHSMRRMLSTASTKLLPSARRTKSGVYRRLRTVRRGLRGIR